MMAKLIKILGYRYPKETSKQKRKFCLLECGECSNKFETVYPGLNKVKETRCKSCASSITATKHGQTYHRFYNTYIGMQGRCHNKNHRDYHLYGGRGIKICDEWKNDVTVFLSWCDKQKVTDGDTLDRRDNDKGYSPDNCRFVSRKVQNRNTRLIDTNNISGYRGITVKIKNTKKTVYIKYQSKALDGESKRHTLGHFKTKYSAGEAFNKFIIKHKLDSTLNPLRNLRILTVVKPKSLSITYPVILTTEFRYECYLLEGLLTRLFINKPYGKQFDSVIRKYSIDITVLRQEVINVIRKNELKNKYVVVEKLFANSMVLNITDYE